MSAIVFNDVWEKYRIKFIKEGKVSWEEIWALQEINFKVNKGEVVGIIGENGAGKTTFLRLIAGMLVSDRGEISVQGRVSTLMELGAGFNPEFTGRENVTINARMYGLDEGRLGDQIDKIVEFAGLGKFIDAPVKFYSQGMYMRLAFALAIFVEPEIFLIDDILAVGDEEAQRKCLKKVLELKELGKTIILVSHDMNVINKICDRAILLEKGRIVKEGKPQNVITHYLETVGDKKGIAVLEKDKLRLVFNNGRLNLSYAGNFITKERGGCVSIFVSETNSWISSFNLSWAVELKSADKIIAEGKSENGNVLQIWTLQLLDGQLGWEVAIKEKTVKEPHVDLFINPRYSRWLTIEKQADFPEFLDKSEWHDLGLDNLVDDVLGICVDGENQSYPSLTFKINNNGSRMRIFNTGYEQEARIIQAQLDSNKFVSLNIGIFSSRDNFEQFIRGLRQQFFTKQKAEEERLLCEQRAVEEKRLQEQRAEEERLLREQRAAEEKCLQEQKAEEEKLLREQKAAEEKRLQEQKAEEQRLLFERTLSLGGLRIFIDPENKVIRFYYQDKEITSGRGLYAAIYLEEKGLWLHSFEAQWQIDKISDQERAIRLDFKDLCLQQLWKLKLGSDNRLEINITMEADKQISLASRDLRLEVSEEYKEWKTAYEQGNFSVAQYFNDVGPIRIKDNKISKVILNPNSNSDFLSLSFHSSFESGPRALNLFKRKETKKEFNCINSSAIIPKNAQTINPGKSIFFTGEIILGKHFIIEEPKREEVKLINKDLKFIFDSGRGMILWQEKELTKALGIYTSVRSKGIWYDSFQAAWSIKQVSSNKIIAKGDWPHIPISQNWQLELLEKDLLFWKVDLEIYGEVDLEIEQANLMLSPEYRNWVITGANSGEFLDEYSRDYDILPFRFWYGKPIDNEIAVTDSKLPDIYFINKSQEDCFRAIIENTDFLYQARVLQYQKTNAHKLDSNKYPYFEGIIKIEPKK